MSAIQEVKTAPSPLSTEDSAAKTNALIAYALMGVGLFTGIFWFIGAIWGMIKKEDAKGTFFEDHYSNITRTFWWALGFTVIGLILSFIGIGTIILFIVWIWAIYRVVKGVSKITSNKAYKSK